MASSVMLPALSGCATVVTTTVRIDLGKTGGPAAFIFTNPESHGLKLGW